MTSAVYQYPAPKGRLVHAAEVRYRPAGPVLAVLCGYRLPIPLLELDAQRWTHHPRFADLTASRDVCPPCAALFRQMTRDARSGA